MPKLTSRSKTRPRLTTLVAVGVSATVLLTMLSLLALVDHFALDYAEREAGQRLRLLSWQMRDALDQVVRKAGGDVRLLAELPSIRAAAGADVAKGVTAHTGKAGGTPDPAAARQVLESLQKTFPDYAWIGLADADGTVLAATQGAFEGQNVGASAWFQGGRNGPYTGDFQPPSALGQHPPGNAGFWRFIDAAGPVPGADGGVRGVLCVRINWGWARRLAQAIAAPADTRHQADILVVRDDGVIMLGPRETGGAAAAMNPATPALAAARAGASGALREAGAGGQRYLTGYARSGQAGDPATLSWAILARQPLAAALADVWELERRILLLGAILGVAMALGAAAIARRLTRPLNTLSRTIERHAAAAAASSSASASSSSAAVDEPALPEVRLVDSFHEAQVLSQALADLVRNEHDHLQALRGMNEKLESVVAERTREIARKALQLERALAQEQSTQALLQERAAELRAILDNAHDAFIALDPGGVVLDWNRQAERLLGWSRAEVIGQPLGAMVLPPLLRRAYERDMRQLSEAGAEGGAAGDGGAGGAGAAVLNRRVELSLFHRDGKELPVEVSLAYVPRGGGHLFIAFLHDISERRALFASMERMALRDTLTGLPNRRALMQTLPEALRRADRQERCCAVLFLDLDRFKQVNDRHGHDEGDELLRQFAARLQGAVRETDTVGRLAGDEFVLILEMLGGDADAREAADKLLPQLRLPYTLRTVTLHLGASIGIAVHHPGDPVDIEHLLGRADRAMYAQKRQGQHPRG